MSAPNVPTYCFYGSVPERTLTSFIYGNGFNMVPTGLMFGDGDSRINREDFEICRQWAGMNGGYMFNSTIFPGVDHPGSIRNEAVLQTVESIVRIQNSGVVSPLPTPWLCHVAIFVSVMSFVKTII